MSMPPPVNEDVREEKESTSPSNPEINLREIARKLGENDIGNLIFSLGAGIIAFREARKYRRDQKPGGFSE